MDCDSQRHGMDFNARQNPLENEIWVLLGCYAVCRGNSLLTIRDNLSVPTWGAILDFWRWDRSDVARRR